MGAPRTDPDAGRTSNVQVQARLTQNFLIGQTEVTRAQWESVGFKQPITQRVNGEPTCTAPDCPVVNVTWQAAVAYANALSDRFGLSRCYVTRDCDAAAGTCREIANNTSPYECEGFRLPTEAEWEYAARAGATTTYFGGNAVRDESDLGGCTRQPALDEYAWYCFNSGSRNSHDTHWPVGITHRVGMKRPNAWGLLDTHGNVREWVNDRYSSSGYGTGPVLDPIGVASGTDDVEHSKADHVTRGGCQFDTRKLLAAFDRYADAGTDSVQGLRIARTVRTISR